MRTASKSQSLLFSLLFLSAAAAAQTASSPSATATAALYALTREQPLTSIRLTGTVVRTAGSGAESGTILLESAGVGLGRADLRLPGGSRTTVRFWKGGRLGGVPGAAVQAPLGSLTANTPASDGAAQALGLADAWWPAAWFDPAFLLGAAGSPGYTVAEPSANRIRIARNVASQTKGMTAEIAALSEADLDLDPATGLPLSLTFHRHPGGHVGAGVPVEIRYGDWRPVSGIEVPFHIERWITGARELVISVTAVEINAQLAPEEFQLGGAQ